MNGWDALDVKVLACKELRVFEVVEMCVIDEVDEDGTVSYSLVASILMYIRILLCPVCDIINCSSTQCCRCNPQ